MEENDTSYNRVCPWNSDSKLTGLDLQFYTCKKHVQVLIDAHAHNGF